MQKAWHFKNQNTSVADSRILDQTDQLDQVSAVSGHSGSGPGKPDRNMASTMPVVGDLGVAGEAPHCGHFVQRKKRFCRMFVPPGKKFCAEHSIDTNDTTKLNSSGLPQLDARIPCPLDPKHNCQASKLEKHIKVRRSSSTYFQVFVELL